MSFLDLCYREAHSYPGKVPALAARMSKSPVILNNKLNANCDTNHLTVDDAEMLLDFANANRRAAEYFAHKASCVVVTVSDSQSSDMELLDTSMRIDVQRGKFSADFMSAWADGKITQVEYDKLVADSEEFIASILEFRERVGQMVR